MKITKLHDATDVKLHRKIPTNEALQCLFHIFLSLIYSIFCNIYICFQQLLYFYGIKWISQNFIKCTYKGMTSNGLTFDYFLGTSQVQDQKPKCSRTRERKQPAARRMATDLCPCGNGQTHSHNRKTKEGHPSFFSSHFLTREFIGLPQWLRR